MSGFVFEIFEKVLVILGLLYIIEKFNLRFGTDMNTFMTYAVIAGSLIFYATFAHLKMPYGIEY